MHTNPKEICEQTKDFDTAITKILDIIQARKDSSKDETKILNRPIPKSRFT